MYCTVYRCLHQSETCVSNTAWCRHTEVFATWRVLAQLGIVPGYWGFCRHREYPPMSESPLTRQGLPPVLADLVRFYCNSIQKKYHHKQVPHPPVNSYPQPPFGLVASQRPESNKQGWCLWQRNQHLVVPQRVAGMTSLSHVLQEEAGELVWVLLQ